jgi:hypothetical protein
MKTTAWITTPTVLAVLLMGCGSSGGPAPAQRPSEVVIKYCTG